MIIMFFNNFIHLLLTYYFENVIPGDFGSTKPWYFPVAWMFPENNKANQVESDETNLEKNAYLEDESIYSLRNIGIKIMGIGKNFKQLGKIKNAVKNLSLNIYEGQISVLLGHNGAGKRYTI